MESPDGILARLKAACDGLSPSVGCPIAPHTLPTDFRAFYEVCGGGTLFSDSPYPTRLLSPEDFEPTDAIMGENAELDGTSASWYIFADDESGSSFSIDLASECLGWCYDTQVGRYNVPGYCPIIARSFTEFVERTLAAEGGYWYWLRDGFVPYGDAYDR